MSTLDKKLQFIELRREGWSFARIASELGVSKRTVLELRREFLAEMQFPDKVTVSREEDLDRLLRNQEEVEDELADRPLSGVPTDKLLQIAADLRKEIRQVLAECDAPEQPASPAVEAAIPGDEQQP